MPCRVCNNDSVHVHQKTWSLPYGTDLKETDPQKILYCRILTGPYKNKMMKELITTLERLSDLENLLRTETDTIMVSVDGLSSTVAEKLSREELSQIVDRIRTAGKKIAVRANMTLHEGMLEKADALMAHLGTLDIHAIFFADPALLSMARKHQLVGRMIYDPETLMTSINDANWWLDRGIEGVSVSPLLTLQETDEISSAVHKAIVTVHGRTLMSRSYRQLLSAYQEANQLTETLRGSRHLYLIESKRGEGRMPVYEDETGTLIYSDNVLDSFDFIRDVLQSDPMGLLIEGSYITLEEQMDAIHAYRRILDGEDPSVIGKEYRAKFSNEPLDSGYYEQKTVR